MKAVFLTLIAAFSCTSIIIPSDMGNNVAGGGAAANKALSIAAAFAAGGVLGSSLTLFLQRSSAVTLSDEENANNLRLVKRLSEAEQNSYAQEAELRNLHYLYSTLADRFHKTEKVLLDVQAEAVCHTRELQQSSSTLIKLRENITTLTNRNQSLEQELDAAKTECQRRVSPSRIQVLEQEIVVLRTQLQSNQQPPSAAVVTATNDDNNRPADE